MSGTKPPVILLVPGAFSTPNCFAKLVPFLNEAGYSTYPGPYPSYDSPDPGSATCQHDIDSLRSEVLLPLLDQEEKDVVILAHSYGGVVAGGAAYGLDKYSRQKHAKMTGIIGLIYVVGNIVLEGESLVEGSGGAFPPFMKVDQPSKDLLTVESVMDIVYHDCDLALAEEMNRDTKPHAYHAFLTKAPAPAWACEGFNGRRAYVRTLDDRCNPLPLQDMWLEKSGVSWEIVDLKTGHLPFISKPDLLAAEVVKFTKRFMAL